MSLPARGILFGTAGIPRSTATPSTLAGIECVSELGLDCLEIEFVRGVKMGGESALKIRETAAARNIRLSVHAPYYINLNSADLGKRLSSHEYLLSSARLAELCGARSVVFHAGYYGKDLPEQAVVHVKKELEEIVSRLRSQKIAVTLRVETMGKVSQFGTFDEVLVLCREVQGVLPCLDFSHLYSREGKANSYREFQRIFNKVRKKLGTEALKNLHIHLSGVDFNTKGEMKHLDLRESDFHYGDWVRALKDSGAEGMVVCESPNRELDALMLKNLYLSQSLKE